MEQCALGVVGGVVAVDLAFDSAVVVTGATTEAVEKAVQYYKVREQTRREREQSRERRCGGSIEKDKERERDDVVKA